ncbi:DUF5666 domain-containing protein [Flindersiella endophytica]
MAGTESEPEQDLAKELAARSGGRSVGKLTLVLVGLVLVVGGFAGGVVFNKATASAGTDNGAGGQQRQFGPGQFGPGQGTGNQTPGANGQTLPPGGFGQNGGFVTGTITAVSGNTVAVKQADGSTKQVKTSGSTIVTLSQKGALGDLKAGDQVAVRGEAADDGTVTAQSIAEGETGLARSGQRQPNN